MNEVSGGSCHIYIHITWYEWEIYIYMDLQYYVISRCFVNGGVPVLCLGSENVYVALRLNDWVYVMLRVHDCVFVVYRVVSFVVGEWPLYMWCIIA